MLVLLFVVILAVFVFIVASGIGRKNGCKAKIQFISPESGRVMYTGNGNSVGSAAEDGFFKMYQSLSESSKVDTITSRLNAMERTLDENRYRMSVADIEKCEHYIRRTKDLLSEKQESEKRKKDMQLQQKAESVSRKAAQQKAAKENALCSRIEYANSLPALLAAIEKARLFQDGSAFSSSSLQCIANDEDYKLVNAYTDRVVASIDELSLQYVSLPEIRKKIAAWKRSFDRYYNRLPPESQTYFHSELEKMIGGEE